MKSLAHSRRQLAAYNNEQLFMLEQALRGWHYAARDDAGRAQLGDEIKRRSRTFAGLERFCRGKDESGDARRLKKVCVLIVDNPDKQDSDAHHTLLAEFFRLISRLHTPL